MYASMYSKTYKHTHTYKRIVMEFNGTRHVPAFHTEHHSLCKTAKKGKSMCEYVCFYIIFYCMYTQCVVCIFFSHFFPFHFTFKHTLYAVLCCTVLYCTAVCSVYSLRTQSIGKMLVFFLYISISVFTEFRLYYIAFDFARLPSPECFHLNFSSYFYMVEKKREYFEL